MPKILQKNMGGITWYVPEAEGGVLDDWLANLKDPLRDETASIHKKGRRKVFASLGTTTDGEDVYIKAFRLTGLSLKLKHLFLRSKALRELVTGMTALERGVPAVVPLAAGEKRRMGLIGECYILLRKIDSAVNLRDYLNKEDVAQHSRSRVIEALGRLAGKSHEAGIFQTDFSLNNFLLKDPGDPEPTIYLIDFERTYVYDRLSEEMRDWALAKLNRVGANFSITDRVRFLKAYSGGTGVERTRLASWMRELDRQTYWILRKDALRIYGTCARGGRGYRLRSEGPFRVWYLDGYNAGELIDMAKDTDNNAAEEDFNVFRLCRGRGRIYGKGAGVEEVDTYKFLPGTEKSLDKRPAAGAWRTANALIKANIPVSPVVGVVETGEGASYKGCLIVKPVPGLEDLRTAFKGLQPSSEECRRKYRTLLWHTAGLLSRLHNHGTLSGHVSTGDFGVRRLSSGRMRLYLARPFKFNMNLTMNGIRAGERELDLKRLETFLGDVMDERGAALLRKLYRLHSSNVPSHGDTPSFYTPGRWSISRFL